MIKPARATNMPVTTNIGTITPVRLKKTAIHNMKMLTRNNIWPTSLPVL